MKLRSIASEKSMFSLLAADQVVPILDRVGLQLIESSEVNQFASVMGRIIGQYQRTVSGVIVAPEVSFNSVEHFFTQAGVVFPLERRNFEADPLSVPILSQNWGVEATSNNYGVAKLELFYNPEEKEVASKKQLVAEIYDYCRHEEIDLLLEVLIYMEGTDLVYSQRFPELQLQAVQELRSLCSLMALEYPLSALGAVTVTAELDVPWILTMRDTPYELAKEQLRTVLESGARGFMAMEQFLPEKPLSGSAQFDEQKLHNFIETTGRDRVVELSRIVEESAE